MNNKVKAYTYICLGKTGSGKSSSCNMILGENKFFVSDCGMSVTSASKVDKSTKQGYIFTVVDTPCVMDYALTSDRVQKKSWDEMIQCINHSPEESKSAFLLVLKYGDRFTEETRKCVDIIETIFGDQCLEKSCIVVFTHGEVFDINNEETNISFENWCRSQHGDLGLLLQRCEHRCILFRNKNRDSEVSRQQIERLIQMTDKLDESYTQEKFDHARKKHKRLHLDSKLPELLKEYDSQLNELQDKVNTNLLHNQCVQDLIYLEKEVNKIVSKLQSEDEGIYYIDGELSLFHQQISRVKQLLKQIHLQKVYKIKDELTRSIVTFLSKVRHCEIVSALDQLEGCVSQVFAKYLDFGLVIEVVDKVNVTLGVDEKVMDWEKEDVLIFDDAIILIEELNKSIMEKRKGLTVDVKLEDFKKKIESLEKKLKAISASETNSEVAILIRDKAKDLLVTVDQNQCFEELRERVLELQDEAVMKVEQCKKNNRDVILDAGVSTVTGAMGVAGQVAEVSDHSVARIFNKAMPGAITTTKSFFDIVKRKLT
ncbi:GTPase IMAP family member 7-like [Biomphalaria glabrata]|uniref:GTPase IMAP family member 7-like n=1 Tax=Biomphalaria glabrata TaxID=6526 RepID=A0A9W3BGW3_BIOGL|nr:GTPase IMAP family member 7-like [Biomphalaria glabrata]